MNIELKDYYAGKALQGLLANGLLEYGTATKIDYLVMISYHLADRMIQHKNESENIQNIINSKQIESNL
jgi:hypothetical protein